MPPPRDVRPLPDWQQFCDGLNLDPDPFTACLPGEEVLDLAANLTERAFTAEEALACMLRQNLTAAAAPTTEDVAAELKRALQVLADWRG